MLIARWHFSMAPSCPGWWRCTEPHRFAPYRTAPHRPVHDTWPVCRGPGGELSPRSARRLLDTVLLIRAEPPSRAEPSRGVTRSAAEHGSRRSSAVDTVWTGCPLPPADTCPGPGTGSAPAEVVFRSETTEMPGVKLCWSCGHVLLYLVCCSAHLLRPGRRTFVLLRPYSLPSEETEYMTGQYRCPDRLLAQMFQTFRRTPTPAFALICRNPLSSLTSARERSESHTSRHLRPIERISHAADSRSSRVGMTVLGWRRTDPECSDTAQHDPSMRPTSPHYSSPIMWPIRAAATLNSP